MGNIDELLRMSNHSSSSSWKDNVKELAEQAYVSQSLPSVVDDMEFFMPYYWDVVLKNEHWRASEIPNTMPKVGTWDDKEYCLREIEKNEQNFRKCLFKADVIDDALLVNGNVSSMLSEFGFDLTFDRLVSIVRTRKDFPSTLQVDEFGDDWVLATYVSNPDSLAYWTSKSDICFQLLNTFGTAEFCNKVMESLEKAIHDEKSKYGRYASDCLNSKRADELDKWALITPCSEDYFRERMEELRREYIKEYQRLNPEMYSIFNNLAYESSNRDKLFNNIFFGYKLDDVRRICNESVGVDECTKDAASEYEAMVACELLQNDTLLYVPTTFHKAAHSKFGVSVPNEIDKSYYIDKDVYCSVCYDTQSVPVKLLIEEADEFLVLYRDYLNKIGVDCDDDWLYNEVVSYIQDRDKFRGKYKYSCYLTYNILGYKDGVTQFDVLRNNILGSITKLFNTLQVDQVRLSESNTELNKDKSGR